MKIELTRSQCGNLSEFIELYLIREIREDEDLDNLDYLRDMLDAEEKFRKASENESTKGGRE